MNEEKSFVGARDLNGWYCCACLDETFGVYINDQVWQKGSFGSLEAVYDSDEWVEDQTCVVCHERYDTAP